MVDKKMSKSAIKKKLSFSVLGPIGPNRTNWSYEIWRDHEFCTTDRRQAVIVSQNLWRTVVEWCASPLFK
jgi:hypothetical protein